MSEAVIPQTSGDSSYLELGIYDPKRGGVELRTRLTGSGKKFFELRGGRNLKDAANSDSSNAHQALGEFAETDQGQLALPAEDSGAQILANPGVTVDADRPDAQPQPPAIDPRTGPPWESMTLVDSNDEVVKPEGVAEPSAETGNAPEANDELSELRTLVEAQGAQITQLTKQNEQLVNALAELVKDKATDNQKEQLDDKGMSMKDKLALILLILGIGASAAGLSGAKQGTAETPSQQR